MFLLIYRVEHPTNVGRKVLAACIHTDCKRQLAIPNSIPGPGDFYDPLVHCELERLIVEFGHIETHLFRLK